MEEKEEPEEVFYSDEEVEEVYDPSIQRRVIYLKKNTFDYKTSLIISFIYPRYEKTWPLYFSSVRNIAHIIMYNRQLIYNR